MLGHISVEMQHEQHKWKESQVKSKLYSLGLALQGSHTT